MARGSQKAIPEKAVPLEHFGTGKLAVLTGYRRASDGAVASS